MMEIYITSAYLVVLKGCRCGSKVRLFGPGWVRRRQPNLTNYVGYFFSTWSGLVILIRIFIYFHLKLIQSIILSLLRWNYGLDIMKALPPIFDIMKILYRGPEFAHSSYLILLKTLSNLCATNKMPLSI